MWEVMPGLPPYGPPALNFSATGHGTHREGFVVRFCPDGQDPWVGSFQPGFVEFREIFWHPDRRHVVVIAGGEAYIVDPIAKCCAGTFGGDIIWAAEASHSGLLVFVTITDAMALDRTGLRWRSDRISFDGMQHLSISGPSLSGEAYSPFDDGWHPFHLDLVTGDFEGGSYLPAPKGKRPARP